MDKQAAGKKTDNKQINWKHKEGTNKLQVDKEKTNK